MTSAVAELSSSENNSRNYGKLMHAEMEFAVMVTRRRFDNTHLCCNVVAQSFKTIEN
jgi:hypothetical protein